VSGISSFERAATAGACKLIDEGGLSSLVRVAGISSFERAALAHWYEWH
jgi:hypothetical protein